MDIITKISEYLTTNADLNAAIVSPILATDPSSVAIRETPSSIDNRYLNKDKTIDFQFQILVKDPSVIVARSTINSIFETLDGLTSGSIVSADGSFVFTSCECSTLPNWVGVNEHNEHEFTAIFSASLEKGGI